MSNDNIGALISGAESLLSEYYPATSLVNVATLTWPSTVVIDGSTYTIPVTSTQQSLQTISSAPASAISSVESSLSASAASSTPASNTAGSTSSPLPSSTLSSENAAQTAASSSSSAATNQSTSGSTSPKGMRLDKRLGIGLGIGLTVIAIGVFVMILLCLRRRKRKTGSYLKHHPVPEDAEIDSWRQSEAPWSPNHQTRIWSDKYSPIEHSAPHMATLAPAAAIGASVNRNGPSNSSSEGSWHTTNDAPVELAASHSRNGSVERMPLAGAAQAPQMSETGYGMHRNRPSTPLTHPMMTGAPTQSRSAQPFDADAFSPVSPIEPHNNQYSTSYNPANPFSSHHDAAPYSEFTDSSDNSNPFSSLEDEDADIAAFNNRPIPPPRSPERRHSPQVHYPSGPELHGFNFDLDHGQTSDPRHAVNTSYEPVSQGWQQEHMYGRY